MKRMYASYEKHRQIPTYTDNAGAIWTAIGLFTLITAHMLGVF